jgi:hypothetical protein
LARSLQRPNATQTLPAPVFSASDSRTSPSQVYLVDTARRRAATTTARGLRRAYRGAAKHIDTCCLLFYVDANFGSQAVTKENNPERDFIATFFCRNNKTLKLTDQFGAALATTLFVNGLISITTGTTDQPIVWTVVMVISGIAIANVISISINQNSLLIYTQYKRVQAVKNNDFIRIFIGSFTKTGVHSKQLLDFEIKGTTFNRPNPQLSDAEKSDTMRLLCKKAVFLFGQDRIDSKLRFVVSNAKVVAEYSPISIAILYLTKDELIVYSSTFDIIEGELQTEDIYHIRLKDVVDVSSTSSIKRMRSYINTEIVKKFQTATNTNVTEIACRQQKIRITKTDGFSLFLPVGPPEYTSARKGSLDGNGYTDQLTHISHAIIQRINDARVGLRGA